MEYKIFSSDSINGLEKEVNDAIKNGWHPQGGVMVTNWIYEGRNGDELSWEFYQAMTRLSADTVIE